MNLPDSYELRASEVRQITRPFDPVQLAQAFCVSLTELQRWNNIGVPAGPTAAALRYLRDSNSIELPEVDEACLLCQRAGHVETLSFVVCRQCWDHPKRTAAELGWEYAVSQLGGVGIRSPSSFERPLFARFSAQFFPRGDVEIGDVEFDGNVHIDTDDYEALFDMFQVPRRVRLVYTLTRAGVVRVNVDEVLFDPRPGSAPPREARVWTMMLVWSFLNERSPY